MPRPPRDASRRYHDRVARQYDAIYDDPYWAFHDELTWRAVKPHLPRDATAHCCDLGCGTGKWGLKLLKSGFPTTFVDHAAAMVEQVRPKLGPRERKATLVVADIVAMPTVPSDAFMLVRRHGRPAVDLHGCPLGRPRDGPHLSSPGGVVIATADNKLAALGPLRRPRLARRAGSVRRPRQDELAHAQRAGTVRADHVHPRRPAAAVRRQRLRRESRSRARPCCRSGTTASCCKIPRPSSGC